MSEELICLCGSKCPEEIVKLRQQLEQAEARVAELEAAAAKAVEAFDVTTDNLYFSEYRLLSPAMNALRNMPARNDAWLLRKQAEAVEACEQEFQGQLSVIMTLSQHAERLRQQADEAEKTTPNEGAPS